MIRKMLKLNKQPVLHFQEVEQKTYGLSTDCIYKIWQKLIGILKGRWETMKEFIVRYRCCCKKKNGYILNTVLDRVINNISKEIIMSSAKFNTEIEYIGLTEAYRNHPFREIEIDVKVPEKMDINQLNNIFGSILEKNRYYS